jgi:hypothetical protein
LSDDALIDEVDMMVKMAAVEFFCRQACKIKIIDWVKK